MFGVLILIEVHDAKHLTMLNVECVENNENPWTFPVNGFIKCSVDNFIIFLIRPGYVWRNITLIKLHKLREHCEQYTIRKWIYDHLWNAHTSRCWMVALQIDYYYSLFVYQLFLWIFCLLASFNATGFWCYFRFIDAFIDPDFVNSGNRFTVWFKNLTNE